MKKVISLSIIASLAIVFLTGCYKSSNYVGDQDYWLSKERGTVVYSDPYCSYYVIETPYGYNILRSVGSYRPYEGTEVYGNFGNYGYREFYNYSSNQVFTAEVVEYWLSYFEAQDAINYYCPYVQKPIKQGENQQTQ